VQPDFPVTRRRLLSTGVAAGLPLVAGIAKAADTAPDLRIGVIGTGDRGKAHLKALLKCQGVRVGALCDTDHGHLAEGVKIVEAHKPKTYSDYRKMLDAEDFDAVSIATPCNLHYEMATTVLQSGRHCYCEKPIGLTVAELDGLVAAVKDAGLVFQVGLQLRYGPPWKTAIEAILGGKIGKPVLIRAQRYNTADIKPEKKWFFDRAQSGDVIVEQAVHEFDLFNWVFGKLPVKASGFGGLSVLTKPPRNIMDNFTLSLEYGPKQRVVYSHCWFGMPSDPYPDRQELVFGDKGAMDLETNRFHPRVFPEPGKRMPPPPPPQPRPKTVDPTPVAFNDFFECIRHGRPAKVGVEVGRDTALVALLGRKAIYEGRVVTMDELLKEGRSGNGTASRRL